MLYEVHFLWNKTHRCVCFAYVSYGTTFMVLLLLYNPPRGSVVDGLGGLVWIQFGLVYGRYFYRVKYMLHGIEKRVCNMVKV